MIDPALPASEIILRGARITDVARLAELAARAYRAAFAGILRPESLARCDAGFFTLRFVRDWSRIRLAENEGEPLGFAMVTQTHLNMLFVSPEHASLGLGSVLLADAEQRGARTLETFRDNRPARRFYERRGWLWDRGYTREFLGHAYDFAWYVRA